METVLKLDRHPRKCEGSCHCHCCREQNTVQNTVSVIATPWTVVKSTVKKPRFTWWGWQLTSQDLLLTQRSRQSRNQDLLGVVGSQKNKTYPVRSGVKNKQDLTSEVSIKKQQELLGEVSSKKKRLTRWGQQLKKEKTYLVRSAVKTKQNKQLTRWGQR